MHENSVGFKDLSQIACRGINIKNSRLDKLGWKGGLCFLNCYRDILQSWSEDWLDEIFLRKY